MSTPGSIRLKFTDSTKALKSKKGGPPVGHFFLRAREGDNEPWRLSVWLPHHLAGTLEEPVDEKDYHDVVDGEGYGAGIAALQAQIRDLADRLWSDQCATRVIFYRTVSEVPGNMVRLKGFFKPKSKQAWWAQLQNEQHRARTHYERQTLARLEDAWAAGWPRPNLPLRFPWTDHPVRVTWDIARKALGQIARQQDKIRFAQEQGQLKAQLREAQEAASAADRDAVLFREGSGGHEILGRVPLTGRPDEEWQQELRELASQAQGAPIAAALAPRSQTDESLLKAFLAHQLEEIGRQFAVPPEILGQPAQTGSHPSE